MMLAATATVRRVTTLSALYMRGPATRALSTSTERLAKVSARSWWAGAAGATLLGGGLVAYPLSEASSHEQQEPVWCESSVKNFHKAMNVISLDEFRGDHGDRVWVALDRGVYDVTPFLDAHPGGNGRIEMVNGFDLAKFWAVYRLHDRPHIRNLLEEYRIGTLTKEDYETVSNETVFSDMYVDDPQRPKDKLRIPSERPWNSEPVSTAYLVESFYTPNDVFFIRNHNPVPVIDEKDWALEIGACPAVGIKKEYKFTLNELKNQFPRVEVVATLQCAGNRQEDYVTESRPLYVAPHWRNGAIGCAKWAGVKVRDILQKCGCDVNGIAVGDVPLNGVSIVNFIAADADETGVNYAGVIPVQKVIDPFGDAILAYEMNGQTLPRDHGYPVRLLAPGHAGCRNVKWVNRIEVADKPSELDAGARLDRHFAPDISWKDHLTHVAGETAPKLGKENNLECKVRLDQGPVIQTLPVQSIICIPEERQELSGQLDYLDVKGVAWSGAGRGICRVELSVDGGKTFSAAELRDRPLERTKPKCGEAAPPPEMGMGRNWAWKQYEKRMPLPEDVKDRLRRGEKAEVEIVAKAIDGDFNSQPEQMSHSWNVLGVCVNHWPRVKVVLDPALPPGLVRQPPAPPPAGSPYWADGKCQACGKFQC